MGGMRQKTLGKQVRQGLAAEGRDEALAAEVKQAEPPVAKPALESPASAEQLMEEVCDRENLDKGVETRSRKQGKSWRGWDDHRRRQGLPA